jgi:hypothetical protein
MVVVVPHGVVVPYLNTYRGEGARAGRMKDRFSPLRNHYVSSLALENFKYDNVHVSVGMLLHVNRHNKALLCFHHSNDRTLSSTIRSIIGTNRQNQYRSR